MLPPERWSEDIEEWLENREYGLALEALAEAVMDYQRETQSSPKVIYAGPVDELLLSPGAFEDGMTAGRVDAYRRVLANLRMMRGEMLVQWLREEITDAISSSA